MEKLVHSSFIFIFFMVLFTIHVSAQPQLLSSQSQVLLRVQQLLNHPPILSSWSETTNFCNTEPNPSLTLICYEGNITQLHIIGNSSVLPQPQTSFTSDSLFSALSGLQSLKVLSLVCLGLQGHLSGTIGSLSSLEILNISSNHFTGSIPEEVTSLNNLQTLILDHNSFTGEVPAWLQSSKTPPVLSVLSLKNNSLTGHLPFSLSSLQNFRVLDLSMNNFSGEVPDLTNLTNLQVLDLGYNRFGPHFPNLHAKLVTIVLRENRFSLGIPANLSTFYHLQKLDISMNRLTGPFPQALLSLPSLSYLDISRNKLTGVLRRNTSCNDKLAFVSLSWNHLAGELPSCLKRRSRSSRVVVQYAGNCLWPQPYKKLNCQREAAEAVDIVNENHEKKHPNGAVLGSVLVGGVAICGVVFMAIRKVKERQAVDDDTPKTSVILERVSPAHSIKLLSEARYVSEAVKLGSLHLPPYRTFLLEELKEATNDFSSLSLIGEGSHGKVYKGALTDGTFVAIRSLKMRKKHNIQFYTHQIEQISKLRHSHLVSVIGHCFECYSDDSSSVSMLFLVFEFVGDGTLRGCLNDGVLGQKFTWTQRIAAALGVARGIQFLHTGIVPGLFANNLKITDVLLDQDFHVKISKYNLPLLTQHRRSGSVGDGSYALEVKEPNRVILEDKDDVYDMGVILLEIIFGRSFDSQNAIVVAKDLLQVSLAIEDSVARRSIVDPVIQKDCCDESLKVTMEICVRCLSSEPTDRPSVEDVLWNLQFAAQLQDA